METNEKIIVEHREVGKLQDSLEIGTPAKGGAIKIYTSFDDKEKTEKKILNAVAARKFAQEQLDKQQAGGE